MYNQQVLLTFDLEEFDIADEYGSTVPWEEKIAVGRKGMQVLTEVIEFNKIPVTIFTTAGYALENKKQLKFLSGKHEIASHTYHHSQFKDQDLEKSKLILEEITGNEVYGLRMPRMKPISMSLVKQAGFKYDSSINPTFIPGKYNNTHLPTTVYKEDEIYRFPCSVSPNLKIPLFWFTFKNSPYWLYKKLAADTISKHRYLNLYFHPWEFTDLTKYKLPYYIKRHSGSRLVEKLHRLIVDLKKESSFETMNNFLINQLWD